MSFKVGMRLAPIMVAAMIALWVPGSSAHTGFSAGTLRGTWVFAESYWGSGQEAAYVGTIRFDGAGSCTLTWTGIKAQGGRSVGEDTCTYEVARNGTGKIIPDSADDIAFVIAGHGERLEYIVDSANVGQVGRGTMTRR